MKNYFLSSEIATPEYVGGKGHNLQQLVAWNAPVPDFFVISTDAFDSFQHHKKVPFDVIKKVEEFLVLHPIVALRSSMVSEDQFDSSFAGMFETVLHVTIQNWQESLLRIYQSVHSSRVQQYLKKKNIKSDLRMAVVVQKQISVTKSGVLFTRSPVPPTSAMAIDAAHGMGEGVVSGLVDVDHYLITRSGSILEKVNRNSGPVLNEREIDQLRMSGLVFESRAGRPSDIEWGILDGQLYIFQIRPITRNFSALNYFVDTNLSESYPGSVSPFTASFVKKSYENVFIESAVLMGGEGRKLESLKYHYARIISSVDNHLYYNLEHYYAILRTLPGGEKNIDNWHKMIGGKMELENIPFHDTRLTVQETINSLASILRILFSRRSIYQEFLGKLEGHQREIENQTSLLKDSADSIVHLNKLINRPLGFGLTVVNDVFIMFGLGYLSKALKKKAMAEALVIDLLKTSSEVDSLAPLRAIDALIRKLSQNFLDALERENLAPGLEPFLDLYKSLSDKGWNSEIRLIEMFIQEFGDRSFEELKLESLPLKNNPKLFFQLLNWTKSHPNLVRTTAKNKSIIELSFSEKRILKFTRDCIAMRESTRLWRGRFYHLLRQVIIKLADQLKAEDVRWAEFGLFDFFSINHEEWLAYRKGLESFQTLQAKILDRRAWMKKRSFPEFIEWTMDEPLPELSGHIESTGELKGQGVSPGIVEGMALVLESPDSILVQDLSNFILVTKNTDPAWVYIMSRSLGLISEKGSLLSHTAIIGRELGIPTLVGVKNVTNRIVTGMKIRIDGSKGTIEVL